MVLSESCKLSRTFSFSCAYDVNNKGGKCYKGFKTIDEMEAHILQSTNSHYYEQITQPIRKLYMDIDYGSESTATKYKYMTHPEFKIFITDLITTINKELNILNSVVIVQVAYKKIDDIVYISSCHIIYKSHMMTANQQGAFIQYINTKHKYKLDTQVYKTAQLFRLVNMCKYGKSNILEFFQVNYNFNDCIISNVKDCIMISHKFILNKPITKQRGNISKISKISNTPITAPKVDLLYNDISNIFNKIIDDLNMTFWNSSDWLMITKILIKKETIFNIFEWLEISANKSNSKYTIEQNTKFYEDWTRGDNVINTKSGIPKLSEVLSKHLFYNLRYNTPFNMDELIKFIIQNDTKKILNVDHIRLKFRDDYNKFINMTSTTKKLILQADGVKCDVKTGFINITGEPTTNYYYDCKTNKTIYNLSDLNYNHTFEKIDDVEISNIFKDFLINNKRLLVVSGSWGVGKTYHLLNQHLKNIGQSGNITALTPNNAFNIGLTKDLNNLGAQSWISHLELNKMTNRDRQQMLKDGDYYADESHELPNIISSLESIQQIHKVGLIENGIYDEFTSIFSHFEANTTNLTDSKKYNTFKLFRDVLKNTNKIIILDANIIPDQINTIKQMINITDEEMETIKIKEYKFKKYNHIFFNKTNTFNNKMIDDLKQDLKICITTNSKKATTQYLEAFQAMECNTEKTALIINGDCIQIIYIVDGLKNINQSIIKHNRPSEKQEFLRDLENNIIKYKIDILIYSPTVSMGVSLNKLYFDKVYANFCINSLNARGCLQQIYRVRNLKKEEINILVNNGFKPPIKAVELEAYKKFILQPARELTRLLKINDNKFNNDKDYINLRAINRRENLESNEKFIQVFINYLQYYRANISYNIEISTVDNMDIMDINTILQDKAYEEYLQTEFITYTQYIKLHRDKEHGLEFTDDDQATYNKYNKLVRTELTEKGKFKKIISHGIYKYNEAKELYNSILINRKWFNMYYYTTPPELTAIRSYLTYSTDDDRDREQLEINIQFDQNDEFKTQHIKKLQNRTLTQIINLLGIEPDGITSITNKQLNEIIFNNSQFFRHDLINYCRIAKIDTYTTKAKTKDAAYYKTTYNIIKKELSRLNLICSYKSRSNTNKPNDIIIISQPKANKYIFDINYINKNTYHRFKKVGDETIFKNPTRSKQKAIISKIKNMTYKTYNKNEVIKNKRAVYNEHQTPLYKHILTSDLYVYKEYKNMISPKYQKLKEQITPIYTGYQIINNVIDEVEILKDIQNEGDKLDDTNDIILNVINGLISGVIINNQISEITKYKETNNINLHDKDELKILHQERHKINLNTLLINVN